MKTQDRVTIVSRSGSRDIGRGVIINLGSANSYVATPNIIQYTTAKHAVMGITKNAGTFSSLSPAVWLFAVTLGLKPFSIGQCSCWYTCERGLPVLGRHPYG